MKKILIILVLPLLLGVACTQTKMIDDNGDNDSPNIESNQSNNKLDLSNQGLIKVSQSVFSQTNLQELDLSGNKLTGALPAAIRHLQNLIILDASNNQMTGVPAEVGQLNKLEILDLSNNQLTGLPHELGNLQNLKTLNLTGNQVSQFDLDIIKQNLPASVNIVK